MFALALIPFVILGYVFGTENLNVIRKIDLRSPTVRIEYEITVDNFDSKYEFVMHPDDAEHLAYIGATTTSGEPLQVSQIDGKPHTYSVQFGSLKSQNQFKVLTVLTGQLEARPAEILQNENQYIKYVGNVFYYSSYTTVNQQTRVVLPSGALLKHTNYPEPVTQDSTGLKYGPYNTKQPYSHAPMHVHFENNIPFLIVTQMTRQIEISHWGNIAVEETFEILNDGAKLRGSFSRLDFTMGIGRRSAVVSFRTALPAAAKDIYYRDEIGNISTSNVFEMMDSVEVELSPRFPLVGGWKTQYTIGYNVPAHEFLSRNGDEFSLRMRFMDHVYDDQFVRNLTLKIVVPEMATNIKTNLPFPVYEQSTEVLKTYLDTVGRTVLVFKAGNLVTEHIKDFVMTYHFNMLYMLREPLMLVTAFALIFFCAIVYVRLDFSIFRDEKSELYMQAQALVDESQEAYKQRSALYQSFEDALQKYITSKDASQFQKERRALETEHKSVNTLLTNIQTKMSSLYSDGVEKLKELSALDHRYRELLQESTQLVERFVSGGIPKARYQSSVNELIAKKADLVHRMQVVMENL